MFRRTKHVAALLLTLLLRTSAHADDELPNVLFLIIDDLRVELPVYGRAHIKASNIEQLASEGVVFDRAYANVPVCGASRASLMTGIRPTRNRFVGHQARIDEEAPDAVPLHAHLKDNGYHTESLGKVIHFGDDAAGGWSNPPWHPRVDGPHENSTGYLDYQLKGNIESFLRDGEMPPFEAAYVSDDAYYDGKIAARAVASLERLRDSDQPFFLAVGFLKPHLPFNAPRKYWDLYSAEDLRLADNPAMPEGAPEAAWHQWGELRKYAGIPASPAAMPDAIARRLRHGYYASVSYVDAQVGRLLTALQDLGLADNTIVVLLGDHGWSLGEHGLWAKHSPFNVATQIPLIVRVPGIGTTGHASGLVELVDVFPSLLELLGLPGLAQLQGRSFVAQLKDPDEQGKQAVFPRWKQGEVIKTRDFALTEWFDDAGKVSARMLYDHRVDRDETVNVAEQDDYRTIVGDLHRRLLAMIRDRGLNSTSP